MKSVPLAAILVAVTTAAGCGEQETNQPPTQPPPGGPLVTYERSSGLAYTAQRRVVEQDGSASLRVEGYGKSEADFELSGAELDELRAALDEASLDGDPGPVTCSDCYSYSIEYGGQAAGFDQTAIPPETEPALGLLEQIVTRESRQR